MLQPGDVFGEYALLPPGRNTATCRTAAPSRLLRLPLAPLRTALQGQKTVWRNLKNWLRLHTLLHFRRERAFLGFMSAESGLKLLDRLKPATFSAGETIQANGLAADTWHLIDRGTVRLQTGDEPEATGGVDLSPGETFGERGLLGSGDLPTAVALIGRPLPGAGAAGLRPHRARSVDGRAVVRATASHPTGGARLGAAAGGCGLRTGGAWRWSACASG